MPRVCNRLGDGVAVDTPPGPVWEESRPSVGGHPEPPTTQVLQGLIPLGVRVGGLSSGGLQGRSSTRTNLRIFFMHRHM